MGSALDDVESTLPERGLGDILNETFVIYGRHFRKFLGLAAVVQVPAIAALLTPIENLAIYIILNLIILFALVSIFGATIYAVGQHYVTDSVTIVDCYRRLAWRLISMAILAAIVAAITAIGLLLMGVMGITPISLIVAFTLMLGAYIVPAMAGPVVIVEGARATASLSRTFELAGEHILRLVGHMAIYLLVAVGLGIVLFLPFAFFLPSDVDT
ncbi:MAG: hypothetical protein QF898_21190, partial [SAR202 cluster bacterium]|nr:hypothetical protein [SAR202 cluster bacterium]